MRALTAGVLGGLAGGLTMNLFARVARAARDENREAAGAAPGLDRDGRGAQPPQARGRTEDDAAVKTGTLAYKAATGHAPDPKLKPWLGTLAHYGFSAAAGACYGIMAERLQFVRSGHGALYGTLVWVVADEGVTPALGLSRGPRELHPAVHAYALAGHLVFGATLESVVRLAMGHHATT